MILKIAWRNIWRNKRRTAITAASIFFAVLFSVAINSLNRGIFDNMIDNSVSFHSGFAQVVQKGYWEERSLDKAFQLTPELQQQLTSIKCVKAAVPRLESFALTSYGKITKTAAIIGIDPEKENQLTGLSKRVKQGSYLQADDQAVLLSEGLAQKLKLGINDTIVLISQGYQGVNAAGKYPVKGLVSFGSPELNAGMIYMPLATAQWFYGAEGLITAAVLDIDDKQAAEVAVAELRPQLKEPFELKNWQEMMPELMDMKDMKESSNIITVLILYLIVAFGIFGTILMMTKEREYEFGVLLSIGMKRRQLALSTWIETLLLGFLGAFIGISISYALMYYLKVNPIEVTGDMATTYAKFGIEAKLPASTDWDLFYVQGIIVMLITTILALYPAFKIWGMNPVQAMRG